MNRGGWGGRRLSSFPHPQALRPEKGIEPKREGEGVSYSSKTPIHDSYPLTPPRASLPTPHPPPLWPCGDRKRPEPLSNTALLCRRCLALAGDVSLHPGAAAAPALRRRRLHSPLYYPLCHPPQLRGRHSKVGGRKANTHKRS